MERQQIATNESVGLASSLSEPRFDDEATLLSARPVVPLNEVKATADSRRRLIVALAMTATLLIGVLGGAFYTRLGNQIWLEDQAETRTEETTESAARPQSQDNLITTPREAKTSEAALEEPKLLVVEKGEDTTSNRAVGGLDDSVASKSKAPRRSIISGNATTSRIEENAATEFEDEEEVNRAERRRERRRRRAARQNPEPVDDLLRIREIFEGSSQP